MKFLTAVFLFALCGPVSAQEKNEMFAKAKEQALSNVDKRISSLNEMKSCFSGATNQEGMKACRKKHKEQMEALHESNEARRKEMKSERKARREKRKKK